jgi:hypothetical protein
MPRWSGEAAWSADDLRRLRKLARTMTAVQMAPILGRTVNAIRQKCHVLGVPLEKRGELRHSARHPEALVERVRDLHDSGKGPAAIAKTTGVKLGTVRSWVYYQTRALPE